MAEKLPSLVLDALSRAAAEPGGLPLLGNRTAAGLFTTNAAGKQAAQHAKDAGLIRVLRVENKGKSAQEICTLTDKGLAVLLEEANPRLVVEALAKALDSRQHQVESLLESARASQEHLHTLRLVAEKALQQLTQPRQPLPAEQNGTAPSDAQAAIVEHLKRRHATGALDDCPLPELVRQVRGLSIGKFHDVLRGLYAEHKIYLHPWTGPLYELPEPACALLVGHEVAYYASLRSC